MKMTGNEIPRVDRENELSIDATPPQEGHINLLLVRHTKYESNTGSIAPEEAEKREKFYREYFSEIIKKTPEVDRRKLKVLIMASPAELYEPYKEHAEGRRAMETADAELKGAEAAFEEYGIPGENIIHSGDQKVFGSESLVGNTLRAESPEFYEFLVGKAREKRQEALAEKEANPGAEVRVLPEEIYFYILYESDAFRNERQKMGAEGPEEMANRTYWNLSLVARSMRYEAEEGNLLTVIVNTHGDNIRPTIAGYLKGGSATDYEPTFGHDDIVKIDYNAETDKMDAAKQNDWRREGISPWNGTGDENR